MDTDNDTIAQNKSLVTRFVREVLQDLNKDAIDELLADAFQSHTWGFKGDHREGLKQATVRMGMLADRKFTVDDLIAEGDQVAARLTSSGRPTSEFHGIAPTGRSYTIAEIHVFRIRDGKIVEHWHQFDGRSIGPQLRGEA